MKKLSLILIVAIAFCAASLLVGCDWTYEKGKQFNIKNSTADTVFIKKIEFSQAFEIKPRKTATVYIDSCAEAFDLEVVWKGETYVGNTDYIDQSYGRVTIELMEGMNCKITLHLLHYRDNYSDINFVQLEKREE
jgi:hypothetical protein